MECDAAAEPVHNPYHDTCIDKNFICFASLVAKQQGVKHTKRGVGDDVMSRGTKVAASLDLKLATAAVAALRRCVSSWSPGVTVISYSPRFTTTAASQPENMRPPFVQCYRVKCVAHGRIHTHTRAGVSGR